MLVTKGRTFVPAFGVVHGIEGRGKCEGEQLSSDVDSVKVSLIVISMFFSFIYAGLYRPDTGVLSL